MDFQLLDAMSREGLEQVIAIHDRASGLRGFLGIHSTERGPAFGGVRRWNYLDEGQALRDCLRLARAMTYKCALADLPAGGAKIVLLDRPDMDWERAYRFVGRVVEGLGGRVLTGPDVGTGERELNWIAAETNYVTRPGPEGPGELAESTSRGVLAGIAAALQQLDGEEDWRRRTIMVQGLGDVGARVARGLAERGVRVLASENDPDRERSVSEELGLECVHPSRGLEPECDVFAPCALGGILHDVTVTRLRARIVAGAANNVLARPSHGDRLHARGILYVPDFVINSGALIRGATFHLTGRREPVARIGERVGDVVARTLRTATAENLPPERVARREAERTLARSGVLVPLEAEEL